MYQKLPCKSTNCCRQLANLPLHGFTIEHTTEHPAQDVSEPAFE